MENSSEIKIRALPRGGAKTAAAAAERRSFRDSAMYIALVICVLGLVSLHDFSGKSVHRTELPSVASTSPNQKIDDAVTRHMQDAEIRQEMMRQTREMENLKFKEAAAKEPNLDDIETLPDNTKDFGVRFDSDESFERVYDDIHPETGRDVAALPGDKINSRLANRKWINQMERAEKIQFLTNFVRTAYEHGYEVEIDANLVVVGVKRVQPNQKLNINQVIDRLAKGQ